MRGGKGAKVSDNHTIISIIRSTVGVVNNAACDAISIAEEKEGLRRSKFL